MAKTRAERAAPAMVAAPRPTARAAGSTVVSAAGPAAGSAAGSAVRSAAGSTVGSAVGTAAESAVEPSGGPPEVAAVNEVHLVGRVSAEPESRTMPSGDELVVVRLVVARPPERPRRSPSTEEPATRRPTVDTIDVACWTARARRSALRLRPGDVVEVNGALRRRFYRAGAVALSRYEVEASGLRRS